MPSNPAAHDSEKPPPTLQPTPSPLPHITPQPHPELTNEQQTHYETLLSDVRSWTTIPSTTKKDAPASPLHDADRLFLTRECLLRYLRATRWHVADASRRLQHTLSWKREYGVANFTGEYMSPENETGKQIIFGFDNEGRPCLYMHPSRQNTPKSEKQIHHMVYMLDRAVDLMPPGQETCVILVNFKDSTKGGVPSVAQGKDSLHILQTHYPERLGKAFLTNLPWFVSAFLKLISPLIDPATKSKMFYNEPLDNHVPIDHLSTEDGGSQPFDYKHDIYWPALVNLCEQRQREYYARWEKAGKHIGEHEMYLRGGDQKSMSGGHHGSMYPEGFLESGDFEEAEKKLEELKVEDVVKKPEKPDETTPEKKQDEPHVPGIEKKSTETQD